MRQGQDPSLDKHKARTNPTIKELCGEYIERHSIPHNKPSTVKGNRTYIKVHIIPRLGKHKVADVTRTQVAKVMSDMVHIPGSANHVLSLLGKMFNCAELWGYRADGTNPCRLIPKYPEGQRTRLIKNPELATLYAYMDRAEADGLEHPTDLLAIRLQFAFAARMSEILNLQWDWVEFDERRVIWPDSKTGGMAKPLSDDAHDLLWNAPRFHGSPYVVPAITKPGTAMGKHSYWEAWKRILAAAGLTHVGTHGIRHRAATDIANSGVPLKVGMALTAHKTVTMFMRYVHVEGEQVRDAADVVAHRRHSIIQANGKAPPPRTGKAIDLLPAGGNVTGPASSYRSLSGQKRAANDR